MSYEREGGTGVTSHRVLREGVGLHIYVGYNEGGIDWVVCDFFNIIRPQNTLFLCITPLNRILREN